MGRAFDEIKSLHKQSTFGAKEGLAFKYFSRPLASFILYFIKDGRLTPNQVTILSLIVGIVGSVVHVTMLTWGGLLLGGALFMLAHVLDALDGQLARYRKAGSVVGMHFDFFIDEIKAYLMYVALALRLFFQATSHRGEGWLPGTSPEPSAAWEWGSPTLLLDQVSEFTQWAPLWIVITTVLGMTALAMGISCTQFLKRPEWKEAFPAAPTGDRAPSPSFLSLCMGQIERLGHFVVDYPSYIIILCLINRVDIYFLGYTLVVAAYALRSLLGVSIKLWRVNPYSTNQ